MPPPPTQFFFAEARTARLASIFWVVVAGSRLRLLNLSPMKTILLAALIGLKAVALLAQTPAASSTYRPASPTRFRHTAHATNGMAIPATVFRSGRAAINSNVAERGLHHKVVRSLATLTNSDGRLAYRTNSYTELATGMHYLEDGEWKEARELIEPFDSGAIARYGQHKVNFAGNLNSAGAIDLEMPDGNRLRGQVLGLAYYDSASRKSVLIGEVKNCQGQIVASNQVVYADAFTDVRADVRYTYTRAGFEQDIILRVQPPSPAEYGLDPRTTRLQVITEFLNPPTPAKSSQELNRENGAPMPDESLDFGAVSINEGRAFALEVQHAMIAPVAKQWQVIEDRHFLIEEVGMAEMSKALAALPRGASLDTPTKQSERLAALGRQLPARRSTARKSGRMLTASLVPEKPGVVLDYLITLTGKSNFTLQGDTTYFVSGAVLLSGTTTIEGNTVVKFSSANSARIRFSGPVVCKTGPYRPAIFTAEDDNTVGEPIGTIYAPVGYYSCGTSRDAALSFYPPSNLSHLRMSYLRNAIVSGGGSPSVTYSNCQFVNCLNGIGMTSAGSLNLRNVLFSNVLTNFNDLGYSGSVYLNAQQVTFDAADCVVTRYGGAVNMNMKNCVFASVGLKNPSSQSSYVLWSGDYNGFYNSPNSSFGTTQISSSSIPFQTSDGGKHYLTANSNFRGAGTTSIDSALLTSLKSRTTQPPIAFPAFMEVSGELTLFPQVPRYGSGPPDLGYHYDPIDFTVAGLVSSGATITVKPGTVVATRQEPILLDVTEDGEIWTWSVVGIWLDGSSTFVSHGTPTNRNTFVAIRLVQEDLPLLPDVDMIEPHSPEFDLFVPNAVDADGTPTLDFRFCDFSVPPFAFHIWSGRLYHNYASFARSTSSAMFWRLRDCNVNSGRILLGVPLAYEGDYGAGAVTWQDNLFARVEITLDPCQFVPRAEEPNESPINVDLEFEAYNNLFRGGRLQLNPIPATGHDWLLRDNLFDKVAFQQFVDQTDGTIGPLDHDYNAYWPRTVAELESDPWYVDHLLANTTDRSPSDTVNNRELGATPAYQSGPLGDYYLATSSELYSTSPNKRGSRTAAEAGLYHYTTRTDQTKDGAQTGNVIIGRHYVATASSTSTQAKDSDAPTPDGIPDFLEEWNGNGTTELGEGDPSTPQANMVAITGVTAVTGDIYVYVSAKDSDKMTGLSLTANGYDIGERDSIGWPLRFKVDTRRIPNGQCLFQAEATYPVSQITADSGYNTISSAPVSVGINNLISYPEWEHFVGRDGYLFKVNGPSDLTSWTIDIYDVSGAAVRSLTGTTAAQLSQVAWDLRDTQGNLRNDYNSDPRFASSTTITQPGGNSTTVWNQLFQEPPYPQEGRWTCSYQDMFKYDYDKDNQFYLDLQLWLGFANNVGGGAFFELPSGSLPRTWPVRYGQFDAQSPPQVDDPGLDAKFYDQQMALEMLGNPESRNFFYFGHGSPAYIYTGEGGGMGLSSTYLQKTIRHRYRFVFLYGCQTARDNRLARAFGIDDAENTPISAYSGFPARRPAAFLGCTVPMPFRSSISALVVNGVRYNYRLSEETAYFLSNLLFWWGPSPLYNRPLSEAIANAKQNLPNDGMFYRIIDANNMQTGTAPFRAGDHLKIFGYPDLRYNQYNQIDFVVP